MADICNILKGMKKVSKGQLFNVFSNTRTEDQEAQRVGGMVETRRGGLCSHLIEESNGMLCSEATWMLKSSVLVQCADLLPGPLAEYMASLKAELSSQRLPVTNGQRHWWHAGIISGCAGGRRSGAVCVPARSIAVRHKAGVAASIPQCLEV